jgi:hypothetical protein
MRAALRPRAGRAAGGPAGTGRVLARPSNPTGMAGRSWRPAHRTRRLGRATTFLPGPAELPWRHSPIAAAPVSARRPLIAHRMGWLSALTLIKAITKAIAEARLSPDMGDTTPSWRSFWGSGRLARLGLGPTRACRSNGSCGGRRLDNAPTLRAVHYMPCVRARRVRSPMKLPPLSVAALAALLLLVAFAILWHGRIQSHLSLGQLILLDRWAGTAQVCNVYSGLVVQCGEPNPTRPTQ